MVVNIIDGVMVRQGRYEWFGGVWIWAGS